MKCEYEKPCKKKLLYSNLPYGCDFVFLEEQGIADPVRTLAPARKLKNGYVYFDGKLFLTRDRSDRSGHTVAKIKPKEPVVFVLDTGE